MESVDLWYKKNQIFVVYIDTILIRSLDVLKRNFDLLKHSNQMKCSQYKMFQISKCFFVLLYNWMTGRKQELLYSGIKVGRS